MTVIFTRTDSGINNMHIFKNVDFVIYTEGTDQDLESGLAKHSQDIAYWKRVFKKYDVDMRFKFKCAGSKPNVISIAERISKNEISNTIAIMDSDHDRHRRKNINCPFVLYTYGYSWENDVWTPKLILSLVEDHFGGNTLPDDVAHQVEKLFFDFKKNMKRFIRCHILCNIVEIRCIPKSWNSLLKINSDGVPQLQKSEILAAIRASKARRTCMVKGGKSLVVDPWRDCYGKLWQSFSYFVFNWLFTKKLTISRSLPRDVAVSMAMTQLDKVDFGDVNIDMQNYYEAMFLRLKGAIGV